MNYRIRYRQAGGGNEVEALVEANSPNEAVVKFRCTRQHHPKTFTYRDVITSVSAVDHPDCLHW